jgi:putative transposase
MADDRTPAPEPGMAVAAKRLAILRPFLNGEATLAGVAANAGIPLRTAQHWAARYRENGPAGLVRQARSDIGARKFPNELVALIEGMALTKPRLSAATIHRRVSTIAPDRGWQAPSYGSVHAIINGLGPAMLTLAHEGGAAFRDRYELVHRHRAERPNATWQADHTQLDIVILDANGAEARPWLTTVLDDYSRVIAGYMVFLGAPSALNTSLALRQAIWRKLQPDWPVCGIPDVLHVDHGSDFTSLHLDQAAADLRFQLIYSTIARPQGRGKIERLFRTINTELLPELPGTLQPSRPASKPRLSLPELDAAIGAFIVSTYNGRVHGEIGASPLAAWRGDGWLPRMPESLEELDTLLVMVAKPRVVHRDGIYFEGLRFSAPTLAAYVGEPVTIRYDPRDVGEVRVFHRNAFLCRAVSPEHAGQSITLKDVQAARVAYRRRLAGEIREKTARVADFLPAMHRTGPSAPPVPNPAPAPAPKRPRLRTYFEDG